MENEITLDSLVQRVQYTLNDELKSKLLMGVLKPQLFKAMSNPHIRSMYKKLGVDPAAVETIEDIPFVPVQMFKDFDLSTCPKEEVFRTIRSSGTTANISSKVPLNKKTTANQTKALKSILSNYLGEKRRVLLLVDHPGVNSPQPELTARGAGVRGLSIYAKEMIYLLKEEGGLLTIDESAMRKVASVDSPIFVFGFTFIIWSIFLRQAKEIGLRFDNHDAVIFHSGGWKKMEKEKVSREEFSAEIAEMFGASISNVHDFYGMAEQTGIIFVECEHGHKHVPDFSQIVIRDLWTMKPLGIGQQGLIEVCSPLGDSYYSQAVLTEDKGRLLGIDDCPCGRKGRYFQIESRVEKSEIRGCGDTFREGRTS